MAKILFLFIIGVIFSFQTSFAATSKSKVKHTKAKVTAKAKPSTKGPAQKTKRAVKESTADRAAKSSPKETIQAKAEAKATSRPATDATLKTAVQAKPAADATAKNLTPAKPIDASANAVPKEAVAPAVPLVAPVAPAVAPAQAANIEEKASGCSEALQLIFADVGPVVAHSAALTPPTSVAPPTATAVSGKGSGAHSALKIKAEPSTHSSVEAPVAALMGGDSGQDHQNGKRKDKVTDPKDQTGEDDIALADGDPNQDDVLVPGEAATDESIVRQARKLQKQIARLERGLTKLKNFVGADVRTSVIEMERKMRLLNLHLMFDEVPQAIDMFRDVFKLAEESYFGIRKLEKHIDDLREQLGTTADKLQVKREIDSAQAELNDTYEVFGRNYSEYTFARRFLEDIIAKNGYLDPDHDTAPVTMMDAVNAPKGALISPAAKPSDKYVQNAKALLAALGAGGDQKLFPELGPPEGRPGLEDVRDLFSRRPLAVIAMLKKTRSIERRNALRIVGLPFLTALRAGVAKIPSARVRRILTNIFLMAYDDWAADQYFPAIERVLKVPLGTPGQQSQTSRLDLLLQLNASSWAKDELLITFVRVTNTSPYWEELKAQAKQVANGDDKNVYATYLKRMEDAQTAAANLPSLALFNRTSWANKVVTVSFLIEAGFADWAYKYLGSDMYSLLGWANNIVVQTIHQHIQHITGG